jgi:hypothetical protein
MGLENHDDLGKTIVLLDCCIGVESDYAGANDYPRSLDLRLGSEI